MDGIVYNYKIKQSYTFVQTSKHRKYQLICTKNPSIDMCVTSCYHATHYFVFP